MIEVEDECEFVTLIADLIKFIANSDKFTLKIWVSGSEIPFEFDKECDFLFLQEGFRATRTRTFKYGGSEVSTNYIFYDNIVNIQVREVYEN